MCCHNEHREDFPPPPPPLQLNPIQPKRSSESFESVLPVIHLQERYPACHGWSWQEDKIKSQQRYVTNPIRIQRFTPSHVSFLFQ